MWAARSSLGFVEKLITLLSNSTLDYFIFIKERYFVSLSSPVKLTVSAFVSSSVMELSILMVNLIGRISNLLLLLFPKRVIMISVSVLPNLKFTN